MLFVHLEGQDYIVGDDYKKFLRLSAKEDVVKFFVEDGPQESESESEHSEEKENEDQQVSARRPLTPVIALRRERKNRGEKRDDRRHCASPTRKKVPERGHAACRRNRQGRGDRRQARVLPAGRRTNPVSARKSSLHTQAMVVWSQGIRVRGLQGHAQHGGEAASC